jgi:hypothetical protein
MEARGLYLGAPRRSLRSPAPHPPPLCVVFAYRRLPQACSEWPARWSSAFEKGTYDPAENSGDISHQPKEDGRTLGRCGPGFWGGCKPRYSRCPSVPHDGQVHTVHKSAACGFYPWGRYKLRGLCRRVVTSRRSAYDLPTSSSLLPPTHTRRTRAHGRLSHGRKARNCICFRRRDITSLFYSRGGNLESNLRYFGRTGGTKYFLALDAARPAPPPPLAHTAGCACGALVAS